jgi:hypothetical protein
MIAFIATSCPSLKIPKAMIRPFDWRDLPILHRYRNQGLCLNNSLGLTRGTAISSSVLFSFLTPTSGFFTWVTADEEFPLLGQLHHPSDSTTSRISFLAPQKRINNPRTQILIEHLAKLAGKRGAFHVIAEIDELAPTFEVLRKAGFGVFARQRIWKITDNKPDRDAKSKWFPINEQHLIDVQTLFHNVVPGLVAQIETLPVKRLQGLLHYDSDTLLAYIGLIYGIHGIWAQPFIHPDTPNIDYLLDSFIKAIPDRRSRPVFLCVRTYQSWLEPAIGEMESQPSPLQAVMVKRLAIRQKLALQSIPKIDGQTEISTPVIHSHRNN